MRRKIRESATTPVLLLGAKRSLSAEVIEETCIMSDLLDINEEIAAELLLFGKRI